VADSTLRLPRAALEAAALPPDDRRTLGRDLLALTAILLVLAGFHMTNPLLLYGTQFGSAFRNTSLQPALALALIVCAWLLGRPAAREAAHLPRVLVMGAVGALATFALFVSAAVLLRFNAAGALAGVDQAVFAARLTDQTPTAALETALLWAGILEWGALIGIVVLWRPWERLPVYGRTLARNASPLLVAVLALIAWEVLIIVFNIQQFLLPRPSVIGTTLADIYPRLVSAGWNTFQNAFWGYVIGCGSGILVGIVSARFIGFSRALLPIAVGINAVPIIALAPIMNNWFGGLSPNSKIAIVALLTFFPALISAVRGLTSVDALSLELMRSYAGTEIDTFRKLRLPSALPFIFAALKVGTTLSMIGAIVGEYFGGATTGLGYRIRDDAGLFKYPEAWSAILVAALFGILFYLLVSALERALMSWHVSFREK
jgi:NitT/TauT family transport system permease protein